MLRRLRTSAGLSQERLAEHSGISANGVAALEAGRRKSPRLNTVGLLCDALRLDADQRASLIAAAVGTSSADPAARSPLPTPPAVNNNNNTSNNDNSTTAPSPTDTPALTFVGRRDERAALHRAWDRKAKVAVLSGEPGVGKTTLADQFASDLAARGVTVLRGRSTPEQLGVYEAFIAPVRQALGRYDGTIPTSLRDLGRLVPGLLELDGDVLVPSRSDHAVERRLLFETVRTLLSSCGPTLLVLDDLHWADQGTLALLSFVAAQHELADLLVVATIRSTDVTPATNAAVAELRRHCEVVRIELSGLQRAELADLVAAVAGIDVSDGFVAAITDATNGNPLYTKELTEHLLQRGLDAPAPHTSLPDGIRHTIGLRVAGLSKDAQSLLRAGAVLGQTFDLQLAGRLASLDGEALLGAAEDALLSGLLIERSATFAAFSHGLVATTVSEATPSLRRLALHRAAAEALTDRGPSTSAEIVDVARHWARVAEADPLARAIAAQWSIRAGNAASASAAIDEAIACYERAIALSDGSTSEHADALMRLGSALTSTGRIAEGKEQLRLALRLADASGDANVFARAALGLSASVRYTHSDPERIAELEAAIEKLAPSEMVLRPALLATLRRQLGFVDTEEADRRRTEAATLLLEAVSADDVSDELVMSLGGLRDSLVVDDPIPLGQLARRIIAVASTRRDLPALSTGWYRQAWSALELGDAPTLRRAVDEYRAIAKQLGRPYELALSSNMVAAVAQIEGRYDDAESAGQEALAHAATIEDGNFSWVYFANSGLRSIDHGLVAPTYEIMRASRPDFAGMSTFEAALVPVAAAAGDHALAAQLLDEQIGPDGAHLDRVWSYLSAERLPVLGLLAWGCALTGHAAHAAVLRDRLLGIAELGVRVVRIAPVGAWLGPLDHHLGALSRILGEHDRAEQHLRRALVVADEMNGQPFRVRTLLELARVEADRGASAAPERSAAWRSEAEQLASRLGLDAIVTTTA